MPTRKNPVKKGSLDWCIKQAAAHGVSYGKYMAEYYEKDMWREEIKKHERRRPEKNDR